MFKVSKNQSVGTQVNEVLKSHIAANGESWLTSLGYGPSNDYAQSVTQLVSCLTGQHVRFETVARYIRKTKASIKAKATDNKSNYKTI